VFTFHSIESACISADSRHSRDYASFTMTISSSPYFSYWWSKRTNYVLQSSWTYRWPRWG